MSVSNLTGTTWLISATPGYDDSGNIIASITYTSNSTVFTSITIYGEKGDEGTIAYRNPDTLEFPVIAYDPFSGWEAEAYRTIAITGGADVTDSGIIEWLEDNAQQIQIIDDVVIKYQGDTIATMTASGTKTLLTADSYCENNIVVEYTKPSANLQAKTGIVPQTTSVTVTPDSGYDGLSSVQINAMPSGSATTPATSITANPSISVSSGGLITATASASQNVTPTVSAGYVSSGTAGTVTVSGSNTSQLTTQAAQTITPTTTNQTIASGKYLTGTQTILGDANLLAENIKKDVSIFNVVGTLESGGGAGMVTILVVSNMGFIDLPTTWQLCNTATVTQDPNEPWKCTLVTPVNSMAFVIGIAPPSDPGCTNVTYSRVSAGNRQYVNIFRFGDQDGAISI